MAKRTVSENEYDSVYFLKVLFYLILGSTWITKDAHKFIPVGLIVGLIFIQHEKLQLDRKIEYALLAIACLLGLAGIGINLVV